MVLFGIWMGRGQRDLSGQLLAGRSLPWWGVLLSIVATETSTVTFLSVPGLAYNRDGGSMVFLQLTIGYIVGRFVIVVLFLPHYFRGRLFTAYEVLSRRFGTATQRTASLLFLLMRNLADGLRLFLTAVVLQLALGLDLWMCIVAIGLATIVYTVLGGMKAVVFNDCIQLVVYLAGAVLAMGMILAYLGAGSTESVEFFANLPGGWERLREFALANGKFQLFDFSVDPARSYTLWSGLFGGVFIALATHGTDQLMVQRYLSTRSQRDAARALIGSGFVVCAQFALFLLVGVGLACFYETFPPANAFARNDEVFPAFIVNYLPVGVLGIVLAAVFSAAMSTLSSSLNCSAAAAVNDFYLPLNRTKPTGQRLLGVSRAMTVAFGLLQIGVAIAAQLLAESALGSVVESVMAIAGFTAGAILGVFFLGVLTRRVSQPAALAGLVGGLAVMTVIVFTTHLAWPWYAIVGSSITFVIGYAASRVVQMTKHE